MPFHAVSAEHQTPAETLQRELPGAALQNHEHHAAAAIDENTAHRDPFWPIGYKLPAGGDASSHKNQKAARDEWQKAHDKLKIGAVTISGKHRLVLINGNTCREGDVLAVEQGERLFHFKVKAVHVDRVEIQRVGVYPKQSRTPEVKHPN